MGAVPQPLPSPDQKRSVNESIEQLTEKALSLLGPLTLETRTGLEGAANEVTVDLDFEVFKAVMFELEQRRELAQQAGVKTLLAEQAFEQKISDEVDRLRIRDTAQRRYQAETHPPVEPPDVRTLKDRLANPPPPLDWRVEGWQPEGTRVMLAAQFKAGKTTLTGNLARCLVDGDWWLDSAAVTKVTSGTVTIIDFEMGERQIDTWLADQKIRNDAQIIVIPMRGRAATFNIIDDKTRARWAAQLAYTEYLIVDCLRPILDALALDEHKDGGRFLTAFDTLCTEAGITNSLIVHHMGHAGERSRGDSRFRDWPDVEWRLVRENESPGSPRYVSAYGRDVDIIESELRYEPTTRHLRVVGGTRANAAARRALDDILIYLTSVSEPVSKTTIEQVVGAETDHPRDAIRKGLEIGIHGGQIHRAKGPGKTLLHTLNAETPRSAEQTSSQAQSVRQNPIGVGAHDHGFGDPLPGTQNAAEFNPPGEDPW